MPKETTIEKTWKGGKKGFDKAWGWMDKLGAPVNKLSNKLGAEAFWPTTMDKECDKAARILRSFCKDGFFAEEVNPYSQDGPKGKQKILKKIPQKVIKNCKGLAIFTTMRSGLWVSGAGGSGILVAHNADGSWSCPSGILLHTAGIGFLVGVDIYDCVVVINTDKALEAFKKIRATVGGELSAVAGPVGVGGILDTEIHTRQAPVWTYLKSRGFYAGVQIDGTVLIERGDENERFYHHRYSAADILEGKVRHTPYEARGLLETLKAAQGDSNVDQSVLPQEPPPGDAELEREGKVFGIPDQDDDDPFGVLALEKEGLEIREAGSHSRPTSEQFEFNPAPTSPIYSQLSRRSVEGGVGGGSNSRRTSRLSTMSNRGTQTEPGSETGSLQDGQRSPSTPPPPPQPAEDTATDDPANAALAQSPVSKARIVNIPKRIPPALPPRNPGRSSRGPMVVTAEPIAMIDTETEGESEADERSRSRSRSGELERSVEGIKLVDGEAEAVAVAAVATSVTPAAAADGFEDVALSGETQHGSKEVEEEEEEAPTPTAATFPASTILSPSEPTEAPAATANGAAITPSVSVSVVDDQEFHSLPGSGSASPVRSASPVVVVGESEKERERERESESEKVEKAVVDGDKKADEKEEKVADKKEEKTAEDFS
ncbi:MAG: hypothetical protein M1819_004011 [Sarea resinae]|nr:MAG: hypothetical protein M1819_004011 [Sarea resinae]